MSAVYTFLAIDSRPAQRAAMLALLASAPTLGIEVTDAAIADACALGNIDPQHGHDRGALLPTGAFPAGYVREGCMAAIDMACGIALPSSGTVLATIRPDLDSVGAMAVLVLRALGLVDFAVPTPVSSAVWRRVCDISSADSYRPGPWAPRPLPTVHRLFNADENAEPADGRRSLAHLGAICSPRHGQTAYALGVRVATMACWLLGGDAADLRPERANDPDADAHSTAAEIGRACGVEGWSADKARMAITDARATVEASRLALAEELARPGAIDVTCPLAYPCEDGQHWDEASRVRVECAATHLAIVRASHAGALGAGYCLAPVVVAFDQATPGKVTIAAAEDGRVDFAALRVALNAAEGRAAVANSPTLEILGIAAETDRHSLRALGVPEGAEWTPRPDLSGTMVTVKMLHDRGRLIESVTISGSAPGYELRVIGIPQWGGPRNLLGSPQGDGTRLSEAEIVEAVRAALAS